MKRDFVFVWGPDVQPAVARLSAPKIAQLRARCDELIARAEYFRRNPAQLIRIVEMPHLTDEHLPWAPFEQFGHWFKLDYQEDMRRYVLNFAASPSHDDGDGGATGRRAPPGANRARGGVKSTAKRIAASAPFLRDMATGLVALYGGAWTACAVSRIEAAANSIFVGAGNSAGVLRALPSRAAAVLRSRFARDESRFGAGGPEARLEPRLLGQNTGLTMLIYTFVWSNEEIDWSADLFGAPLGESERMLR